MARGDARRLYLVRLGFSFGLSLVGCVPSGRTASPSSEIVDASSPEGESHDQASGSGSESDSEVEPGDHPLVDDREPDPSGALPKLTYQHLGMHIGGEPNDAESKKPWLDAIERGDQALMRCYRLVHEPMKGGSVGVDLYVTTSGGAPEVRATRQKIGGDEYASCMKKAFEALSFHAPARPTVVSYSILFKME